MNEYNSERNYQDKEIQCAEPNCGPFVWTAKDQAFYADMGFNPPKRCKMHAEQRRAFFDNRNAQKTDSRDFVRGGNKKEYRNNRGHYDRDNFGY